jgi:hypothetical protein
MEKFEQARPYDLHAGKAENNGIWVSGSSRVKTYGSVEHALFQTLADWHFYQ